MTMKTSPRTSLALSLLTPFLAVAATQAQAHGTGTPHIHRTLSKAPSTGAGNTAAAGAAGGGTPGTASASVGTAPGANTTSSDPAPAAGRPAATSPKAR